MQSTLSQFEKILGYKFRNIDLLKSAFTHSSMSRKGHRNYERLEFLGDRILGLVVAKYLFHHYPNDKEGGLAKRHSKLVSGEICAQISESLNINPFIIMTKGEEDGGGRNNKAILADICESLIAALYLDGGFDEAEKFILNYWAPYLNNQISPPVEPKTALQEWVQGQSGELPIYSVLDERGPSHDKIFTVKVDVKGFPSQSAEGKSKKNAETAAAKKMYELIMGEKL